MYYQSLYLKDFRNYSETEIKFHKNVNIFLGKNGQGKTNIIEALYLLTQGSSFRYGENSDFIQKNKKTSIIRSEIFNKNLLNNIAIEITENKKNTYLNNKKVPNQKLVENFPVVLFSPESLNSIKEGADQRRSLIDQHLVNIDFENKNIIHDFKKALKTRNKILKDNLDGITHIQVTNDLLDGINSHYIPIASKLSAIRVKAIKELTPEINNAMRIISNNQNVDILVDYVISNESALHFSDEKITENIKNRIQELRQAELSSGTTLVGPQKHDVKFLYNGNDSRFYCSQGQQRALILSYNMAQIVYHRKVHKNEPVLMLDDVLSELDSDKRFALISFLKEINSQIFITTTDLNLPQEIQNQEIVVHYVEDGKIRS